MTDFAKVDVCKVDQTLGLVFGYAIVCKVDGADYYDTQDDHIPEDAMLEALCDFMQKSRNTKDMHSGDYNGTVVFAFPVTTELAKALGWTVQKTGAVVAMKPNDKAILDKYASGEYQGFSIGGKRLQDEEVAQ